ncbi:MULTISPECIES: hypothetical protein [unclassified Ensifer]|uniref:hypothetical protein n=1 Tax=unclassified Ensifer TaxID=2633371 RepID=UPI0008134592|nr:MULTISPECIES: hypothetical protein [unclassified Ensifer]OCO98684.1 hypothetical protein BC362_28380 [Ensifer sp. LC14]OCP13163.1 hypothetical protein BC374_12995 [Ensifer sp. LC13]OCP13768.1 hypothetical protein BBX50_13275 [Ensifer sp. LC11]OCP28144.1 hypothetical protein BC364_11395 [Ensifer sp. LC499]
MAGLLGLFRGERSLSFTYWVCYVGGSAAAIAAIYAWLTGAGYLLAYPTAYRLCFYLVIGWVLFVTCFIGAEALFRPGRAFVRQLRISPEKELARVLVDPFRLP